jgi:hypothetical protein
MINTVESRLSDLNGTDRRSDYENGIVQPLTITRPTPSSDIIFLFFTWNGLCLVSLRLRDFVQLKEPLAFYFHLPCFSNNKVI